jgi:vacuolar-type H+-ATPase subunit I/STV1
MKKAGSPERIDQGDETVKDTEKEEEEMMEADDKVVSVFRMKLLEAQLQENLFEVMKENNFEQQILQDMNGNQDFVSDMNTKIAEIQKWRQSQLESLQQEYSELNLEEGQNFQRNPESLGEEDAFQSHLMQQERADDYVCAEGVDHERVTSFS